MSALAPFPAPKTPLGIHRILAPQAGVRVSPLCLGAMNIGDAWTGLLGSMTKEQSFKLLDAFYEAGGNFIDTASNYQNEQSEQWVGEWMEAKGVRDQMVIATKFTTNYKAYELRDQPGAKAINFGGNHTKCMNLSVRDSLKKLRTDYIDLLYLHWWDFSTNIEEVMRSLDHLVRSGKVFYLGISDTPAWIVTKANQYARCNGLTPFVVYQGLWNVNLRDFERDIIPMCIDEGMALAPWGAVGAGKFQSKAMLEERKKANESLRTGFRTGSEQTPDEVKISAALEKVGKEVGASVTAVALAYCLQRTPYVFPIIGGRKVEHLMDNIRALEITLTQEQIAYLESEGKELDIGFPHNFMSDPRKHGTTPSPFLMLGGQVQYVKFPTPLQSQK